MNIVLDPDTVDKYLRPKVVSTQIVYRNGKNSLIANGEHYCDDIKENGDLIWKENDPNLLSKEEEVKIHLKL